MISGIPLVFAADNSFFFALSILVMAVLRKRGAWVAHDDIGDKEYRDIQRFTASTYEILTSERRFKL